MLVRGDPNSQDPFEYSEDGSVELHARYLRTDVRIRERLNKLLVYTAGKEP
jgi:hypothetical protein